MKTLFIRSLIASLSCLPLLCLAVEKRPVSIQMANVNGDVFVVVVNEAGKSITLSKMPSEIDIDGNGIKLFVADVAHGKLIEGPLVSSGSTALGIPSPLAVILPPHAVVGKMFNSDDIQDLYELNSGCYMVSAAFKDAGAKPAISVAADRPIKFCVRKRKQS